MIVGQEKPPLDELVHFGIKGMHWGVRKGNTLSKSERAEASANYQAKLQRIQETKYSKISSGISQEQYKKLSTKSVKVQSGQDITRITLRKNEKFRDLTYVAYKPGDVNAYRSAMPAAGTLGGQKKYKDAYEATYKSLETLRSPSEKERVDAFISLFDTPSVKLRDGRTVTGRKFLADYSIYSREAKTLNAQQLGLKTYTDFLRTQWMDIPINEAYFNKLRAKGYNAVVDDNDRGHLAETPLILLNPNGSLKKLSVKKLTADDVNNAQRKLNNTQSKIDVSSLRRRSNDHE